MADANAKPTSSCGDGTTVTDRGCTVSKQTDCEGALAKVAHKNNVLPNGCLKHSLEENGRVRLLENAEDTSVMLCGNGEDSEAADASSCNAKCECEHVSNCSGDSTVNTICANNKVTGQNGDHNSELANDETSLETCCKGIADVSLAEPSNPSEGCSPELAETVAECSSSNVSSCGPDIDGDLEYVVYESELQMPDIMRLITKDLSEPYSIYTYRYFIHNWPRLCFLAMDNSKCVGAIVCKHDLHKKMVRRGYIAMLAVDQNYRRRGIGSHLVMKAIRAMVAEECDEVVLETEITNKAALRLYENLGFLRDKRLFRYYLNGVDALRLKLWLR